MSNARIRGFTTVELIVVLAIVAVMAAIATPNVLRWNADQRVKSAARAVSDAFLLARSEAIRTGDNHFVVFAGGLGAAAPIAIVDDGPAAAANCTIDAGEVVHSVAAEPDVSWGTSTGGANGASVPDDSGAQLGNAASGWTFGDGTGANPASWVLFLPDGLPRTFTGGGGACTAVGSAGEAAGGIYLTNGRRDYSIVLLPLGTARVHKWDPLNGGWSS